MSTSVKFGKELLLVKCNQRSKIEQDVTLLMKLNVWHSISLKAIIAGQIGVKVK